MDAYIALVETFIRNHQSWAGPIIGLLTLAESMLVLGLLVPATALLLMAGGLVGNGLLNPVSIVIWGIIGAVIGDSLSYWIGRLAGPSLMHRWPMNKQRRSVARARLFFTRYRFLSIVVGRFLGPLRSTIPTVVGIMRMNHFKFEAANMLSAMAWVPILLAPGFFAARSLGAHQAIQHIGILFGAGVSVVLALVIAWMLLRKRKASGRGR
jgi:membrane protein DedA with SNARE-associated domain